MIVRSRSSVTRSDPNRYAGAGSSAAAAGARGVACGEGHWDRGQEQGADRLRERQEHDDRDVSPVGPDETKQFQHGLRFLNTQRYETIGDGGRGNLAEDGVEYQSRQQPRVLVN